MKRPIQSEYTTCNQFTHSEELNRYHSDLEKYVDYLENELRMFSKFHTEL
jgi:hypothetical protein